MATAHLPLDPVVFLDSSYAIAISSTGDKWHEPAMEIARTALSDQTKLVTTTAILAEIANALAKQRYRTAAISLVDSFSADPGVAIIPFDHELYAQAVDLYKARPDKE